VFAIEMRSLRHLCNASAVGQDFVLMDGNARLHRAFVVNEYIERERNRTYGLACPLSLSNRACMGHIPTSVAEHISVRTFLS